MIELRDKVAIVTGAGRELGQGAATAAQLAALGAAVVLADIDLEAAELRAEEIRDAGGDAIAVRTDVRVEDDVRAMVATAVEEFGRLDVLHNQAADLSLLFDPGDPDITQASVEQFHALFETIVLGPVLGCKHAIPEMVRTGGGSIICTSSTSGMVGELNLTLYGAAKAAVNQLVRAVSTQWGKQGIRCNAVAPGLILTQPSLAIGEPAIAAYERHCDTPRVGQPADIATVVAFLASDAARFVSGQVLPVDGGMTSHSPLVAEQRTTGEIAGTQGATATEWA